ncbi:MAG: RNA methyltransferase [Anaerolineales bacterium]|nr:RNA methyltransferase [Anaerolineales bacterium]MCB9127898.1 RNA methyltransferase [Ardenticatenales bacterium]MCB9171660.1 RNA methyltransferase [Ardenticatenales bacterium]
MIESEQNPKIRLARALQRRREREKQQLIFIEGLRLVRDAFDSGLAPTLLFYTAAAQQQPESAALIARHAADAWLISDELMQRITDTVTPQAIAAIVSWPTPPWPRHPTLLLLPDCLRDPGNLGTLLRSAAAAGVDGVLLGKGTVDPWSDKVLRAGMGAHFRLPIRSRLTWEEMTPLIGELPLYIADAAGSVPYDAVDWRRPAALVVGGEAEGASEPLLARATQRIAIPMANAVESLNAAVAGSLILFEAHRQRRTQNGTATQRS